jgi:hypothetical protein
MNVTINIVELASELASQELEDNWGDTIQIWQDAEDEPDTTIYTEEAQDIFNELYVKYFNFIDSIKINSDEPAAN